MKEKQGHIRRSTYTSVVKGHKREIARLNKVISNHQKLSERQQKEITRLKRILSDYGLED